MSDLCACGAVDLLVPRVRRYMLVHYEGCPDAKIPGHCEKVGWGPSIAESQLKRAQVVSDRELGHRRVIRIGIQDSGGAGAEPQRSAAHVVLHFDHGHSTSMGGPYYWYVIMDSASAKEILDNVWNRVRHA